MTKLAQIALQITSAQESSFTALDGNSRLEAVKNFYRNNGLDLPAVITVTTTKKASYLSKDEKMNIRDEYIAMLENGNDDETIRANYKACKTEDGTITFTKTVTYSVSVLEFGAAVVAAKLIDGLDASKNEAFHKIRKHSIPAAVDIESIPAFIKELQKLYDEAHKSDNKTK